MNHMENSSQFFVCFLHAIKHICYSSTIARKILHQKKSPEDMVYIDIEVKEKFWPLFIISIKFTFSDRGIKSCFILLGLCYLLKIPVREGYVAFYATPNPFE